jgi:large subunit ribosomal protein L10
MSYFVKGLVQNEYKSRFAGMSEFVVIDTTGVGGVDNNVMRGDLKAKGIRLTVVKNSLMRSALKDLEITAAADLFMAGPCTVVYGGDSVVDVAKAIVDWSKKLKAISLKGAYVDGVAMDSEGAMALSKMPSRVELQGQIVQLAKSPGANLAGAIAGPGGCIAGCIKSLIEKLEKEAA